MMICTVGGTPDPLIESIKKKNPDFVYFIASQETVKAIGKIVEDTNLSINRYKSYIIEYAESIIETYEVSRGIIKKIKERDNNTKIFINHTGGTKSMSAGVVLAGSEYGCSFVYVGGKERDKGGVGIVTGDMIVKDEQYPYHLIVEKNLMEVVDYFNRYQYETCINILNDIDAKLIDNYEKSKQLRITARILNDFITLIRSIDSFKFKKIEYLGQNKPVLAIVKAITKDLEMISFDSNILKKVGGYLKRSEEHIQGLQENNLRIIFCELINNAERRVSEGKYDDAVARLYRAIELIAQMKLMGLDVIDEDRLRENNVFAIKLEKLREKLSDEKIEEYKKGQKEEDLDNGIIKLPLKKSYRLLADLGDEFSNNFLKDEEFKTLLQKRNDSILAHGLIPVSKEDAEGLLRKVVYMPNLIIEDFDNLKNRATFPKL